MSAQPVDHGLAALLAAQAGVLSLAQAKRCGLTRSAIAANLAGRRWQRVYVGIYATFSGPLPALSRVWAALLACGPGAVASHQTAAWLAGLVESGDDLIHVTVPASRRVKAPPGVRLHRSRLLPAAQHPAALPPRTRIEATVLDLADGAARVDDAVAVLIRACQRRLTTAPRLLAALQARENLRWRNALLGVLYDVQRGVESPLELHYLRRVERAHCLPEATRQLRIGRGERTDATYEEFGTRIELDGRRYHEDMAQRFRDLRRDNAGVVAGEVTLRYGWADVIGRPCQTALQVAEVLRSRGWDGFPRSCGASCTL